MASTGFLNKKGFNMGLRHMPNRPGATTRYYVTTKQKAPVLNSEQIDPRLDTKIEMTPAIRKIATKLADPKNRTPAAQEIDKALEDTWMKELHGDVKRKCEEHMNWRTNLMKLDLHVYGECKGMNENNVCSDTRDLSLIHPSWNLDWRLNRALDPNDTMNLSYDNRPPMPAWYLCLHENVSYQTDYFVGDMSCTLCGYALAPSPWLLPPATVNYVYAPYQNELQKYAQDPTTSARTNSKDWGWGAAIQDVWSCKEAAAQEMSWSNKNQEQLGKQGQAPCTVTARVIVMRTEPAWNTNETTENTIDWNVTDINRIAWKESDGKKCDWKKTCGNGTVGTIAWNRTKETPTAWDDTAWEEMRRNAWTDEKELGCDNLWNGLCRCTQMYGASNYVSFNDKCKNTSSLFYPKYRNTGETLANFFQKLQKNPNPRASSNRNARHSHANNYWGWILPHNIRQLHHDGRDKYYK